MEALVHPLPGQKPPSRLPQRTKKRSNALRVASARALLRDMGLRQTMPGKPLAVVQQGSLLDISNKLGKIFLPLRELGRNPIARRSSGPKAGSSLPGNPLNQLVMTGTHISFKWRSSNERVLIAVIRRGTPPQGQPPAAMLT